MKIDKKNLFLSSAAGIALIVVGYLVWKHEQTVSATTAQEQADEEATNQAAYAAQLEQELTSMPIASGGGYGNLNGGEVPGNETAVAPVANDTELNAILAAFFAPNAATGTTPGGTSPAPVSGPAPASGITPVSGPAPLPKPVVGPVLTPPGLKATIKPIATQGGGLVQ